MIQCNFYFICLRISLHIQIKQKYSRSWPISSQETPWLISQYQFLSYLGLLLLWWNTMPKSKLRKKCLLWLILPYHSLSLKKVGQELKQHRKLEVETNIESMERCFLPACFLWCDFLSKQGQLAREEMHPQFTVPSYINH